jgi:nucleoside-diphosphate-sugar epimerase
MQPLESSSLSGPEGVSLSGKTTLVTGATGFIGSYLSRRLHQSGAHVIALCRDRTQGSDLTRSGLDLVEGDIRDAEAMESIISGGVDIVFHLAAWLRGGSGGEAPAVNVEATRRLAELSARYGVQRFIFTSSIAVYGPHGDRTVDEATPLQTYNDPYGDSKIHAESAVKDVAAKTGLDYVIIRPGMVYGPGSPGWTKRLALWARKGQMPLVDGGRGTAFPVYIDNLIDLYLLAATHPAAPGETFNAVDDGHVTLGEFSGAYMRMIPTNRAIHLPGWLLTTLAAVVDPFIPGMNYRYVVNQMRGRGQVLNTKARVVLGWVPRVGLQEGIKRSEEWLRNEGIL